MWGRTMRPCRGRSGSLAEWLLTTRGSGFGPANTPNRPLTGSATLGLVFSPPSNDFKNMNVFDLTPFKTADHAGPIPFDNSYVRLPDAFYEHVEPGSVPAPQLIRVNDALGRQLRIDPAFLKSPAGLAVLSGNEI